MKPFVFLDRDGTLIVEKHYLHDPDQVELVPGAAEALRAIRDAGYGIAIVTNQSGVGRGMYGQKDVEAVHRRVEELLAREGAHLDGIYVCPHDPSDGCECRKPERGLVDQAMRDHSIDMGRSFMIGDKLSDLDCGRAAGIRSVLVRTGYGASVEKEAAPAFVADDLLAAVSWILEWEKRR